MENTSRITIIGAGNIGVAIANGLVASGRFPAGDITLTRRRSDQLEGMKARGFRIERDNRAAVKASEVIVIAVEPQQIDPVLEEIAPDLVPGRHVVISVVTGVTTRQIARKLGVGVTVVRAMPNTAIAVRESMTCLASDDHEGPGIEASGMIAATALGACGVAFFLRAIRAASQGGIEIGFHSREALAIAAQTARGAATLLLNGESHPESEIDQVTTPRGCTIAGLNQMEHEGFSSAMIKGITTSAAIASKLYTGSE